LKKKFVVNLALLLFLNLLIKPFWIFGIDRTVQNLVGAQDYGFYFSLFNFSLILNILLDFGITNYNNKNIAQNHKLISKHLSNIIALKFLLAGFYTIVTLAIAFIIGYNAKQFYLLFFLIFNQVLISFTLYLRSNISGLQFFKTDSLVSVLDRSLMIIIVSILLWGKIIDKPFKIEWFVYSQTLAYLITAIITFFIVLSKSEFFKLRFDLKFFIIFLKQSYPYALLILLMAFYNRIDSVMIERLLNKTSQTGINIGETQAGIYAQAYRILDAFTMFAFLFAGLLLPMFAKMIKTKQNIEQLVQLSFLLLIIPAIILVVATVSYRFNIMELLYHNHVNLSANIFGLLIVGFIGISTTYIFGTLLTANGSMKQLNIMAFAGIVINVIINLILIPRLFALGSAIASLSTQTFTAIVQVLIAVKIFKFKINYKLLSTLLLFVSILIFTAFLSTKYFNNWYYGFFAIISLGFIFAFVLRLINIKTLFNIIKYDNE